MDEILFKPLNIVNQITKNYSMQYATILNITVLPAYPLQLPNKVMKQGYEIAVATKDKTSKIATQGGTTTKAKDSKHNNSSNS